MSSQVVERLESMQSQFDGPAKWDTFRFGTVRFTTVRRADLQPLIRSWARAEAPSLTMTLTGAHGVAECRRHPAVQLAHDDADFVLCDGTPPWLGAFILGNGRAVDRIPGREAMREIAAAAAALSMQQAFIGGPPGLAERTIQGLEAAIGSSIEGIPWSPPFVPVIDDAFVDAVTDRLRDLRRPVVVWIGLSTPKQELLMQRLRHRLPRGLFFVAVGAAFDMYAGTLPPPPPLVSRIGLEWLYRSVREPRRLPARYARALPVVAAALAVAVWDRLRRR